MNYIIDQCSICSNNSTVYEKPVLNCTDLKQSEDVIDVLGVHAEARSNAVPKRHHRFDVLQR